MALPNIACGIFGYEPHGSSRIILEEAFEALLQIEASEPQYSVERLTLIDSRLETAKGLQEAMHEVTHRWLPDYRMTTAAQYWGKDRIPGAFRVQPRRERPPVLAWRGRV